MANQGPIGSVSAQSDDARAAPRIPLWPGFVASVLCGIVYLCVGVGQFGVRPSGFCHHVLTANAWVHGRLYATGEEIGRAAVLHEIRSRGLSGYSSAQVDELARNVAGVRHVDWIEFGAAGHFYAYWPPMPAVLMLPLVLVQGPAASDILVDHLVGAITIFFIYLVLRELAVYWRALTTQTCATLALFYGLGTCHFWQACVGQVWFLTQLTATLFLTIAIWSGLRAIRRIGWIVAAGVALGLAFLSRNTIILAAPFFVCVLWMAVQSDGRWTRRYVRWGLLFAAPLVASVAIQLWFNHARFGDPFDPGQEYLAEQCDNPTHVAIYKAHGRFSVHHVPRNLFCYFINPTLLRNSTGDPAKSGLTFDGDGNSLFLVSPAMLFLFLCWRRRDRVWLTTIFAGALPGTIALMLFHGTGYYTFGPRYLLDTMPFLLILVVFGMRGRLSRVSAMLIALSIGINAWGTHRFCIEQPP